MEKLRFKDEYDKDYPSVKFSRLCDCIRIVKGKQ